MNPMVIAGTLVVVLIFFGMIAAVAINTRKEREARAMAVIRGQGFSEDKKKGASRDEQDKRRAEISKKLKEKNDEGGSDKKKATITMQLEQAGMTVSVKQYWVYSIVFAVVFSLVAKFMMATSGFVTLMAFITGLFGVPRMFLKSRIKKRQKKFLEEFADALEAMVRLLKAGMPISEAIQMASREFSGPVGEEMLRIYDAQKIGISLPEAALGAARRMPLTEMQMFATGLSIQAQTGASLSEVLLNLAKVIRARYRLKRKVQALSSEAKASAMIIGSLPFLVGGGLYFINPEYIGILIHTTPGKMLLGGAAVWMMMGIMVMKSMINFKI